MMDWVQCAACPFYGVSSRMERRGNTYMHPECAEDAVLIYLEDYMEARDARDTDPG